MWRIWILTLVMIGTAEAGLPGYLPKAGPMPVRFQTSESKKTELPPLLMRDPESDTSTNNLAANPAASGSATNAADIRSTPLTMEMINAMMPPSLTPLPPGSAGGAYEVTPQMLMPLIMNSNHGTNSMRTIMPVAIPVGFTPPIPSTPRSSTATYGITP